MTAVAQTTYTEKEYLEIEDKAEYKSEYFRGEIFMMAGGTPNHKKLGLTKVFQVINVYI